MQEEVIKITEVQIVPVKPENGLIAFCSFILNNQFYIGNIGIYTTPTGEDYRLVFPGKKLPTGKYSNTFNPISREAGMTIKLAIIAAYEALLAKGKKKNDG